MTWRPKYQQKVHPAGAPADPAFRDARSRQIHCRPIRGQFGTFCLQIAIQLGDAIFCVPQLRLGRQIGRSDFRQLIADLLLQRDLQLQTALSLLQFHPLRFVQPPRAATAIGRIDIISGLPDRIDSTSSFRRPASDCK